MDSVGGGESVNRPCAVRVPVSHLGNWVDEGGAIHGNGEIYLYKFSSLK